MSFTEMAFVPADGLKNITTYPTEPASETAAREMMQEPLDQLKTFLNETLLPALAATAAGQSGAHKIGSTLITGVTGESVYAQIADLKAQIDGVSQGAVTDGSITAAKIATDAVETAKIQDGAVTQEKLAAGIFGTVEDGAVTTDKLAAIAVTADKIATSAVTAGKIGVGAVTADKLGVGAVTAGKIANEAITNDKILAGTIAGSKLAEGAVYNTRLATDSVSNTKLVNGAVTKSKLAATALGWSLIFNANLATSGSVTVPSMSGYSEVMLQIRTGPESDAALIGSVIMPLSSGIFQPTFVRLPLFSGASVSTRSFWSTSATAIAYAITILEGTQRLYVYVR